MDDQSDEQAQRSAQEPGTHHGREWQSKGQDTAVNVYDYRSIADGKAVPYGIYDVVHNSGFVNVGIDHETAEFAVESIRRWWRSIGSGLYPTSKELLIVADGGGSNGARNRLWKMQLQQLATETGLSITICLRPPANGIRLSIGSFPTFPLIGGANR